jgi:hypothetical protein
VPPGLVDDVDKLAVRGFVLYTVVIGKAEESVKVRDQRCVPELGEIAGCGLDVTGDAEMMMDD